MPWSGTVYKLTVPTTVRVYGCLFHPKSSVTKWLKQRLGTQEFSDILLLTPEAAKYTTVCDLEPKMHRRYIDSQAPPWGVLCMPSSPVLTVLRRKVANRSLGALSCPGRSHNAGLTKRPKRLVSYIYIISHARSITSHGKLFCFVFFFIKPTVTGEMAVSSTELGRVTRETRSARSWAVPET